MSYFKFEVTVFCLYMLYLFCIVVISAFVGVGVGYSSWFKNLTIKHGLGTFSNDDIILTLVFPLAFINYFIFNLVIIHPFGHEIVQFLYIVYKGFCGLG